MYFVSDLRGVLQAIPLAQASQDLRARAAPCRWSSCLLGSAARLWGYLRLRNSSRMADAGRIRPSSADFHDPARASWSALRSASVRSSPSSSATRFKIVPSGRDVGTSRTSRPLFDTCSEWPHTSSVRPSPGPHSRSASTRWTSGMAKMMASRGVFPRPSASRSSSSVSAIGPRTFAFQAALVGPRMMLPAEMRGGRSGQEPASSTFRASFRQLEPRPAEARCW